MAVNGGATGHLFLPAPFFHLYEVAKTHTQMLLMMMIARGHILAEGNKHGVKELFERYVETQQSVSQQRPLKLEFQVFL